MKTAATLGFAGAAAPARSEPLDRAAERLDGVGGGKDRMPGGHEAACFCKQEKENPVDDDERLVERSRARTV